MNQVAVVIGGGPGGIPLPWACRRRIPRGVVDIQSDKANVAQEINADFGEGMAYGFGASAASEQSVLTLSAA